MTAEEKWDKLRAHVVARVRHSAPYDDYDIGYKAGLLEVQRLIRRFDKGEAE
jgi:hypothetical protein